MKVDLHYGDNFVSLQIPRANIERIIGPWYDDKAADNAAVISQALGREKIIDFQKKIAGRRLCVLLSDGTRDIPLDCLFGLLLPLLRGHCEIKFIICTGTHNADTEENKNIVKKIKLAAEKSGIGDFSIHVHDYRQADFITAGRTARNTPVMFNSLIENNDIFLVLSDIKCHYFAGYSNPIKNFVPGVCSFETTEQNHRLTLDENSTYGLHPWHRDKNRRNNPLAADQLEAMELIIKNRPVFVFATISTSGSIQWAGFGAAKDISTQAFDIVDRMNTHKVGPVEYLIVSPGGLPNDVNLYIAQRAIEMTKTAVKDGCQILFLSACPAGVGENQTMENFCNLLTAPVEQILKSVEGEYKLFSHKPYRFARLIRRLSRIWIYSQIPDSTVRAMHMHPTHQPQTVVDNWLAKDRNAKILVVDGANKVALYADR